MNTRKTLTIFSLSLSLLFCFTFSTNASINFMLNETMANASLYNKELIIRDNNSTTPLPNRFRNLKNLNISGSAQFRPFQLKTMIKVLNSKNLYIVDLRQESHGFINTLPISFYSKGVLLNKDFNTNETLQSEKKDLDSIQIGSEVDIYSKDDKLLETLKAEKIFSEETLIKENKINYKRFAVRDGGIPTVEVTDNFVEFIKNKPNNAHLHFHCKEGEGRTTTFMSLYQMMNNKEKLSLDDILEYQLDEGGIVLTDSPKRAAFLKSFYDYTLANYDSNFAIPYSTWLKSS